MPKSNPGPGTYTTEPAKSHRDVGFSFPLGPKDAMNAAVRKIKTPGAGEYPIRSAIGCKKDA